MAIHKHRIKRLLYFRHYENHKKCFLLSLLDLTKSSRGVRCPCSAYLSDKSQGDSAYFAMILLPSVFNASFVAFCIALKTLSALHSSIGTICVIMSLCNMSPFFANVSLPSHAESTHFISPTALHFAESPQSCLSYPLQNHIFFLFAFSVPFYVI